MIYLRDFQWNWQSRGSIGLFFGRPLRIVERQNATHSAYFDDKICNCSPLTASLYRSQLDP